MQARRHREKRAPGRWWIPALVALLAAAAACRRGEASPAGPRVAHGFDLDALARAGEAANDVPGLYALLISHRGEPVAEWYFNGRTADHLNHVRSVTKSVLSTLIGIAVDQGRLRLDHTLGELLGPLVAPFPDKADVTIHQLLTMTSGIGWDQAGSPRDFNRWVAGGGRFEDLLEAPLVHPPGARFNYSEGVHLLSVVLTEVAGMPAQAFAQRYLFGPLGIRASRWQRLAGGYHNGAAGLELRPRDMLKIGELFLQQGVFRGRRVVSAEWVARATRVHVATGPGAGYGYLWWVEDDPPSYAASGWAGQRIAVWPARELVFVLSAQWTRLGRPVAEHDADIERFLRRHVLAAVVPPARAPGSGG